MIAKRSFIVLQEDSEEIQVKSIGRVRFCGFYDMHIFCIVIKRPDVAYMFRRKDMISSFKSITYQDKKLLVDENYENVLKEELTKNNLRINEIEIWDGAIVRTESGDILGSVDEVIFDSITGKVCHIVVSDTSLDKRLNGNMIIDTSLIKLFSHGQTYILPKKGENVTDYASTNSIIVSDECKNLDRDGGFAKNAAIASVYATNQVRDIAGKVKRKASTQARDVKDNLAGFKEEFLKNYKGEDN